MKKVIKFLLRPILGKKIFQPFFRLLFLAGLKGMNIGGGSTYSESGESWVITELSKGKKKFVLFDVGANNGSYAAMAASICSKNLIEADIYCFEPAKATFQLLQKASENKKNFHLFQLGMGATAGELTLHSNEAGSGLASVYERDLAGVVLSNSEKIAITTVDAFCHEHAISYIDLLKLDVEGHELSAITGAAHMIATGAIGAIQFEFGGTAIDAQTYLRDFFRVLEKDYRLFRILQNGLTELKQYSEYDELFVTTNFLAIKK